MWRLFFIAACAVEKLIMKVFTYVFLPILFAAQAVAQSVEFGVDSKTGALDSIRVSGDSRDMNWTLKAGQKRYIKAADQWGLGRFVQTDAYGTQTQRAWSAPVKVENSGGAAKSVYDCGDVEITVAREQKNGDLLETYSFKNKSANALKISDIAVNTPFNDNYDKSDICLNGRCHAHIWADGGDSSYVCAINMGARAPHLGLVMVSGAMDGYEISKRSKKTGMSNFRGVIAMRLKPFELGAGRTKSFKWTLFSHAGWDDFFEKARSRGAITAHFKTPTTAVLGEKIWVVFKGKTRNPEVLVNGAAVEFSKPFFSDEISVKLDAVELGEVVFELRDGGKSTRAVANVVEQPQKIIKRRADFITAHQQLNDPSDARDGAFMVFDNAENKIYKNTGARKSNDTDEGAERNGMGILLARLAQTDAAYAPAALRYAEFVSGKLQTPDFVTYSSVSQTTRNRFFNYPWVARLYCETYRFTKDKKWLERAFGTMKSFYRQFGHERYTLDTPVKISIDCLREAGMQQQAQSLLADYVKSGELFIARGENYPIQEVDYEQSIVAPAASHLLELYLLDGDKKWLDGARDQLRRLEAFDGRQPHYRLNNVAIRHWDGFWFGKNRMWGDTFPHYWSALSGISYAMFADATGSDEFRAKAVNNLRANFCLFFADGKASCAYVFPDKVDAQPRKVYDPFANDQDWALAFYLMFTQKLY